MLPVTIPNTVRNIKATEAVLERLYAAARRGLKKDTLALAAGLLPEEYKRLAQLDPQVDRVIAKGRADLEEQLVKTLIDAATEDRDVKAATTLLERLAPENWSPPKDAGQSVFGAGGINIIIGDVTRPVEGRVIDGETA